MKATSGLQSFMRKGGAPATYAIIGLSLTIFVASWLTQGKLQDPLAFPTNWSQPWGILTYPFANAGEGTGLFWFLLQLYWLFWVGASVERELGTPRFVGYFFIMSVVAGLFLWLGAMIIRPGDHIVISSLSLPIAALTVTWGIRHKTEQILLMMVIPMPGLILAWLTVALTLFGYGSMYRAPVIGVFACLHLALAYLYAESRIPNLAYGKFGGRTNFQTLKRTEKMDKSYYDDVKKREKEREERERLRKLFENSMKDDPEK